MWSSMMSKLVVGSIFLHSLHVKDPPGNLAKFSQFNSVLKCSLARCVFRSCKFLCSFSHISQVNICVVILSF